MKYIGHVISADMTYDLDIMRQCVAYILICTKLKSMLLLVVFICARTM